MKKIVLLIFIVALILIGVKLIRERQDALATLPQVTPSLRSVNVVYAQFYEDHLTRTFVATLDAKNRVKLASKISSTIETIATLGQNVQKGETIALLDTKEIDHNIAQLEHQITSLNHAKQGLELASQMLEAELLHVKTIHDRNRHLFKIGGISQEAYESSQLSVTQKSLALEQNRKTLEAKNSELQSLQSAYESKKSLRAYYEIKAPYSGTIVQQFEENGAISTPNKPLVELASLEQLVRFSYTGNLTLGDFVEVDGKMGQIKTLLPQTINTLAQAEAVLDSRLSKPLGSLLHVKILGEKIQGFVLPSRALLETQEGSYILALNGVVFEKTPITVIAKRANQIIIKEQISTPIALGSPSSLAALHKYPHIIWNENE